MRHWGAEWLERREREGVRAIDDDRARWRVHVDEFAPWADAPLASVTKTDARAWWASLCQRTSSNPTHRRREKKPLAAQTLRNILNLVRLAFEDAHQEGLIASNPFAGLKLRRSRAATTTDIVDRVLRVDAQMRALAVLEPPERWLTQFALGSGLRQGEQWSLRLSDVHLDEPNPHVVARFGSRKKKADDGPTKGGRLRRVPIFGLAREALDAWLRLLPTYAPSNPLGLVFPTRAGERRRKGRPFRAWKRFARAAGKHVRWHDLRHTCASSLVGGWWDAEPRTLEEVRLFLGHRSITQTEVYAVFQPDHVDRIARKQRGASMGIDQGTGAKVEDTANGVASDVEEAGHLSSAVEQRFRKTESSAQGGTSRTATTESEALSPAASEPATSGEEPPPRWREVWASVVRLKNCVDTAPISTLRTWVRAGWRREDAERASAVRFERHWDEARVERDQAWRDLDVARAERDEARRERDEARSELAEVQRERGHLLSSEAVTESVLRDVRKALGLATPGGSVIDAVHALRSERDDLRRQRDELAHLKALRDSSARLPRSADDGPPMKGREWPLHRVVVDEVDGERATPRNIATRICAQRSAWWSAELAELIAWAIEDDRKAAEANHGAKEDRENVVELNLGDAIEVKDAARGAVPFGCPPRGDVVGLTAAGEFVRVVFLAPDGVKSFAWFRRDELLLDVKEPAFKVGDRVRVRADATDSTFCVPPDPPRPLRFVGREGVVIRDDAHRGAWRWLVQVDGEKTEYFERSNCLVGPWYRDGDLERIEAETASRFKKGDRVMIARAPVHVGFRGTVLSRWDASHVVVRIDEGRTQKGMQHRYRDEWLDPVVDVPKVDDGRRPLPFIMAHDRERARRCLSDPALRVGLGFTGENAEQTLAHEFATHREQAVAEAMAAERVAVRPLDSFDASDVGELAFLVGYALGATKGTLPDVHARARAMMLRLVPSSSAWVDREHGGVRSERQDAAPQGEGPTVSDDDAAEARKVASQLRHRATLPGLDVTGPLMQRGAELLDNFVNRWWWAEKSVRDLTRERAPQVKEDAGAFCDVKFRVIGRVVGDEPPDVRAQRIVDAWAPRAVDWKEREALVTSIAAELRQLELGWERERAELERVARAREAELDEASVRLRTATGLLTDVDTLADRIGAFLDAEVSR